MSWALRLAARQTLVVPGSVALGLLLGIPLFRPTLIWRGDWELGLQQLFASDLLLFVVVAVMGAQAGAAFARPDGRGDLLTADRATRPVLLACCAAAGPAVVLSLAAEGWVALETIRAGGTPGSPWAWLRFPLAAIFVGCLGVALGRRLSPLIAVPVAAAGAGALYALVPSLTGYELLNIGGAEIPFAGVRMDQGHLVGALLVSAGLALAAVGAAVARRRATLAVALAATTGVLAVTMVLPPAKFVAAGGPVVCSQAAEVTACAFRGYDRYALGLAERVAALRARAADAGLALDLLPTRFVQQRSLFVPTRPEEGGFLIGSADLSIDGALPPESVAAALSYPFWCSQMDDAEPPVGLLEQAAFVQSWLLLVAGQRSERDFSALVPPGLPRFAPDRRVDAVSSMMSALRECRVSSVLGGR